MKTLLGPHIAPDQKWRLSNLRRGADKKKGSRPIFAEAVAALDPFRQKKGFCPLFAEAMRKKGFSPNLRRSDERTVRLQLPRSTKKWFSPNVCRSYVGKWFLSNYGSSDHVRPRSTKTGFRPIFAQAMRKSGFFPITTLDPRGFSPDLRGGNEAKWFLFNFHAQPKIVFIRRLQKA